MTWAFDVTANIPRITQSGTDANLDGMLTAINGVATVARSTAYTTAQMIKPPIATGFWYRCSTAGTTSGTAPAYGTTLGGTTTDGTAVFTAFRAPEARWQGAGYLYNMPDVRVNVTGTLTNANPQLTSFICWDLLLSAAGSNFTSGTWASDGVTPLYDGVHFTGVRESSNAADNGSGSFQLQIGQFTFIGGEVQVCGAIGFSANTTPRSYYTRWRSTKTWSGVTTTRIRAYSQNAIFRSCEFYAVAYDLFRMPVEFSVKARKAEYLAQYVGGAGGGVDAKFTASNVENVDGSYDFDNWGGGWVELYNCAKGVNLNVTSQGSGAALARHCVPLYQDVEITAKNTAGSEVQDVRFSSTDAPTNSPTITFTTASNLKTWDFINPITYQATTNASGIANTSPVLKVWYYQSGLKQNLRFPLSTANYEGRSYNYKTMNASAVLGTSSAIAVSAGMISLDTVTTVTETAASAITGISLVPSGATGGTITISSNKEYQDIWNYYRWWISQYANRASTDTWTCTGGTLNTQNWNIVVNTGVTLSASTNITKLQTLGTITNNGIIQGIYQDSTGTSTTLTITGFDAGSAVFVEDNLEVQKYYSASASGTVIFYIPPTATGSWYYAVEKYGNQRQSDFFTFSGGLKSIVVKALPDTGLTQSNVATVAAYTTLENPDKIYDYVAYLRLSVPHISYGQIVYKNGTSLDLLDASMIVNQSFASVAEFDYTAKLLTVKSTSLGTGTTYNKVITTPPKTITAATTEVITVSIEDANGDSSVTIQGGSGNFTLWKIANATSEDDYATGTNLGNVGNVTYRFLSAPGYKIVIRDNTTGFRQVVPMDKGDYTRGLFFGDQVQLAQSQEVSQINTKVDVLAVDIEAIKGTGFTKDTHSLKNIADNTDAIPTDVWTATTRTLTSAGASGATLAEIEASTVLAKEATNQLIKTKVDTLENYDDTSLIVAIGSPLQVSSYVAPDNTSIGQIKSKVNTLENYDDTTLQTKVDSIQTSIDNIPATDLTGIETDLSEVKHGINDVSLFIPTDLS